MSLGDTTPPPPPLPRSRSLISRWFGPMRAGSLRSGLLVLTTTAMGAGVLTLPFAIKELGWALGSFVTIALAVLNVSSLDLLLDAGIHVGANSYSELIVLVRGPWAAAFFDLTVSIVTWGAITAYFIFIKQLLPTLLMTFGAPVLLTKQIVIMPIVALLVFMISLPRDITALGKFSIVGMCSVMYICGLLILSAWSRGVGLLSLPPSVVSQDMESFSIRGFSNAFALIITGFLCQYNVFFIRADINEPTTRRLRKITRCSTCFQGLCYLSLGLCGYATFGPMTLDNIYMNFQDKDARASFGKLLVCASLCISIPLCVFAARANLVALLSRLLSAQESSPSSPSLTSPTTCVNGLGRLYELSLEEADEQGIHLDNPLRSHCGSSTNATASPVRSSLSSPKSSKLVESLLLEKGPQDVEFVVRSRLVSENSIQEERQKVEKELGLTGRLLHVGATACIILVTLVFAFTIPSVSALLGKLGGLCGVTQMYLMPGLILLRCPDLRPPTQRVLILLGFSVASVIGLATLVL